MEPIYIDKAYYKERGCDLDLFYGIKIEKDYPLVIQNELMNNIIRSPKIVKRALYWGWIKPIVQGGKGKQSLFTPSSISILICRLKKEQPPLLPCDITKKELEDDENINDQNDDSRLIQTC